MSRVGRVVAWMFTEPRGYAVLWFGAVPLVCALIYGLAVGIEFLLDP